METVGTVISVKRQWWLKINTKPVRKDLFDGAIFFSCDHSALLGGGEDIHQTEMGQCLRPSALRGFFRHSYLPGRLP